MQNKSTVLHVNECVFHCLQDSIDCRGSAALRGDSERHVNLSLTPLAAHLNTHKSRQFFILINVYVQSVAAHNFRGPNGP